MPMRCAVRILPDHVARDSLHGGAISHRKHQHDVMMRVRHELRVLRPGVQVEGHVGEPLPSGTGSRMTVQPLRLREGLLPQPVGFHPPLLQRRSATITRGQGHHDHGGALGNTSVKTPSTTLRHQSPAGCTAHEPTGRTLHLLIIRGRSAPNDRSAAHQGPLGCMGSLEPHEHRLPGLLRHAACSAEGCPELSL